MHSYFVKKLLHLLYVHFCMQRSFASNEAKLMINVIRSLYDYLENIGENRSLNQMISEDLF